MKKGKMILASVFLMVLSSCGGNSSDTMFGDIPSAYEEKMINWVKEMQKLNTEDKKSEALALLADFTKEMEELQKEMEVRAEKMKGQTIEYTMEEGLPYQLVSDIQVDEVKLPKLGVIGGRDSGMRLKVKFSVVLAEVSEEASLRLYYLLTGDEGNVGYGTFSISQKVTVGDTLHLEKMIYAPDVPAQYQESCRSLAFVSEEVFELERKVIREKQKEWTDARKKELGLKKE